MARRTVIDLGTYSELDAHCIALNEFYKSLIRAGFKPDIAIAIIIEPSAYPAWILPASPNWNPDAPAFYEDDEDED
jgi:hypothetical protein